MDQAARGSLVRERALELGFDLVGFGSAEPFATERSLILDGLARGHLAGMAWMTRERVELSCDPEALLPGARTIIGLGTVYQYRAPEAPDGERPHGRVARYAWGRDYHDVIRPRLHAVAQTIEQVTGSQTRCRVFVDTGPLVDRAAAVRAGLGFIGKNTCLLTGRHGSYLVLSAILTTAELPADPFVDHNCGSCRACIDACPTEAILGPGKLDATRCISYLTIEHRGAIPQELRPQMRDWVFGCDVCQEVCPWNRARRQVEHPEFQATEGAGSSLDLIDLLGLDDAAFRARFRGTPLTRPKRAGLLRNAAVALGNSREPRAVPALVSALADREPLVRAHAAWGLSQLAPLPLEVRGALERALRDETDDEVKQEIRAALARA